MSRFIFKESPTAHASCWLTGSHREVALFAGNQLGKTEAAAFMAFIQSGRAAGGFLDRAKSDRKIVSA
jgi:hypothetical protein